MPNLKAGSEAEKPSAKLRKAIRAGFGGDGNVLGEIPKRRYCSGVGCLYFRNGQRFRRGWWEFGTVFQ